MATRTIIIERNETNHSVATTYATVFDNGLVDIRRNFRSKLDPAPGRSTDENDVPENRLTTEQLTLLVSKLHGVCKHMDFDEWMDGATKCRDCGLTTPGLAD